MMDDTVEWEIYLEILYSTAGAVGRANDTYVRYILYLPIFGWSNFRERGGRVWDQHFVALGVALGRYSGECDLCKFWFVSIDQSINQSINQHELVE